MAMFNSFLYVYQRATQNITKESSQSSFEAKKTVLFIDVHPRGWRVFCPRQKALEVRGKGLSRLRRAIPQKKSPVVQQKNMIIANINRGLDSKLLGVSTKINNQGIHNGVESCIPHCYLINIDKCPNGEMLVSSAGEVTIHITKLRYPTDTFKQLLYSNVSLVYPPKLRTKKSMKLRRFCHDSVR